jgi:saccharopine dehydrogenase-like NADP-dependent oxidoreductase
VDWIMMREKILVIGGYGAVGRVITTTLADQFPGRVIAAGRSDNKARELAQAAGGKIQPLQLDVFTAHERPEILDDVALVVMCLDQPDTRFVISVLQQGVDYVDITATYDFLARVEALDGMAKAGGSTAVLSVGLAPGLTNLLARHVQTQFDELERIDIHVLLGLGEAHGDASVRWTLQNLNETFTMSENGTARQVESFTDGKQVVFPNTPGRRTVYRFNFADQHVLTHTLGLRSVSTWLAFDPAFVTHLLAVLRRTGLSRLLDYQWAVDTVTRLSSIVRFGSERFVVQVTARGTVNGRSRMHSFAVSGDGQGRATGLVAAQVAERLLTADFPPGVFHIEQLFDPLAFIPELERKGLQLVAMAAHQADLRNQGWQPIIPTREEILSVSKKEVWT